MIRLAIADDEALFRKGMQLLSEDWEGIEVMLEAKDGKDLLAQLATADPLPEVLLLDLNMPEINGIDSAKIIREKYPDIRIIILSTYFSKAFIINMIELGAGAYLQKNTQPELVEKTINEVYKNGFSYSLEVMEVIRQNMMQKTKPKLRKPFEIEITPREKEVLQLICEAYTTSEIAKKLFISDRTVDGHRNNLLQRLGCRNVAGLVALAVQEKLVTVLGKRF